MGSVASEELKLAEYTVWKLVQLEMFPEEVLVLGKNQNVPESQQKTVEKSSRIYKMLPFIGEVEVIRKNGRIAASPYVPYDTKFPVVIPKEHYVTQLLVNWYHRKYGHAGGETVVNDKNTTFRSLELL